MLENIFFQLNCKLNCCFFNKFNILIKLNFDYKFVLNTRISNESNIQQLMLIINDYKVIVI